MTYLEMTVMMPKIIEICLYNKPKSMNISAEIKKYEPTKQQICNNIQITTKSRIVVNNNTISKPVTR